VSGSYENVLDTLKGMIRQIMNDRSDHMLGDGCESFSEYRHQTGVIEGLAIAERELLDLKERIENA